MKRLIIFLLGFLLSYGSFATTYYFNNAMGNDANNGTSTATPFQTLAKFNAIFATKQPGDNFLFNRGDIFYGTMKISRSGTAAAYITIGAYGTGANPVITGFSSITSWTNTTTGNTNIWESTSSVTPLTSLNMVVINGINVPMGRYPNTGYFPYQSSTLTTITSTSVPSGTTNWTGALVVGRKNNWIMDNDTVTNHSGNVLTHTYHPNPNNYPGISGYGFFIERDIRTLDVQNEWYFNPSTKKLRIYSSTGAPTNVQVVTKDTLVYMPKLSTNNRYVIFDGLTFTGSNKDAFVITSCPFVTIQNCVIDYSGQDGIWGAQNFGSPFSPNFQLLRTTINHTNNNAVNLREEFTNALIQDCIIKNTGMQAGMGGSGDGMYVGLKIFSPGAIIEYNFIDSTGYIPIHFFGSNIQVRNNKVTNFDMVKMDGGGIYTWNGGNATNTGEKVYNNLILFSSGATSIAGTTQSVSLVHGIYLDANTANVEAYNNTAAYLGFGGGYSYSGSSSNNWHDNIFYNNTVNQMLLINQFSNGQASTNNTLTHNKFISRDITQLTAKYTTRDDPATFYASLGTFTNNFYERPLSDNTTIQVLSNAGTSNYTLAQWKTASGNDVGSQKSPLTITDVNDLVFVYNDTKAPIIVSLLPYKYLDVDGVTIYDGTITLQPFTSAVMIKNGNATGGGGVTVPKYSIRHNNIIN